MIYCDGYSLMQTRDKVVIGLPPTKDTVSDTVSKVSNRKPWLTDEEQIAVLELVINIFEGVIGMEAAT